jgi:carboxyl-terminal processing protease
MTYRYLTRVLLALLCCKLALPLSAQTSVRSDAPQKGAASESLEKPVQVAHLTPAPWDGRIAFVTAKMLEMNHYSRMPFDESVSSKFLDRYLEALDPQHMIFIQPDLAEFEHYRTNLGRMTINRKQDGDTRPATEIFNRFMERLAQRTAYADELLKTEKFDFSGDDRITINRHEMAYPKDLNEAKKLWRERLRFEYLQEKLGRNSTKKKPETTTAKSESKPKSEAEDISGILSRRYHRNMRLLADWDSEDVLQIYLTALAHVYDPHSDYLGKSTLEQFSINMSLALFGIGAELTQEDGYCTIRRLLPGPASKSKKIHEKDKIIAVAQAGQPPVDVVEMNLTKAVQLIRGPKGSEVTLTIIPADGDPSDRKTVTLVRDEIKLEDQEAKAKVIELPNAQGQMVRLGVIDLPSFYGTFQPSGSKDKPEPRSPTEDVKKLLVKFKKENINGVILDLRHNGGGSLEEAVRLTGLFIKDGPIVQLKNSDGTIEQLDDTDPSVAWGGPLIVLTSRWSASASEILAGALQDYGRALVVGDSSTHGKGSAQGMQQLAPYVGGGLTNDPGYLKLTNKKFFRASGATTQLKGVIPDIVLPSILNESKDVGESALDNPLKEETISSAKFQRLNMVEPYLPELRKRSTERVAADKDYQYIVEDIEQFKKMQADKTISLNEKQRLKEKEEIDARDKARNQERLARKEANEKIYELTLRQVDQSGLPPAVEKTNTVVAKVTPQTGGTIAGAAGTNSASVTKVTGPAGTPAPDSQDATEEEKAPVPDVSLVEAEHILVDYLSIFPKQDVVSAGHPE